MERTSLNRAPSLGSRAGQVSWGPQRPEMSTKVLFTRDYVHFPGERVIAFTVFSRIEFLLKD